jgi:hypothetical protein
MFLHISLIWCPLTPYTIPQSGVLSVPTLLPQSCVSHFQYSTSFLCPLCSYTLPQSCVSHYLLYTFTSYLCPLFSYTFTSLWCPLFSYIFTSFWCPLLYHRERILKTSTLSCNEEKEEITKPPPR